MRKKNYCFTSLVIFSAFILLPIAANVISVCKFPVNTTGAAWIGFWGSYLGGIATLVALLVTLAMNVHHQNVGRVQSKIESLNKELQLRISDLRLTQFLEKILSSEDWLDKKEEHNYELLRLSNQYQAQINSIDLLIYLYGNTDTMQLFVHQYKECLSNCIQSISYAIIALNSKNPQKLLTYISVQKITKEKEEIQKIKDVAFSLINSMKSEQKILENASWYEIVYNYIRGKQNI